MESDSATGTSDCGGKAGFYTAWIECCQSTPSAVLYYKRWTGRVPCTLTLILDGVWLSIEQECDSTLCSQRQLKVCSDRSRFKSDITRYVAWGIFCGVDVRPVVEWYVEHRQNCKIWCKAWLICFIMRGISCTIGLSSLQVRKCSAEFSPFMNFRSQLGRYVNIVLTVIYKALWWNISLRLTVNIVSVQLIMHCFTKQT